MSSTITDQAPQPYTILRIKRKRNEEPLDALVVEASPRRKKSRGGPGFFQFAQTIDTNDWNQENQKLIQSKIDDMNKQAAAANAAPSSPSPPPVRRTAPLPSAKRTYTIVTTEAEKEAQTRRTRLSEPPKVLSTVDKPAAPIDEDFTMYDAVLASKDAQALADEEQMAKFMPMLQDYLNLDDNPSPSPAASSGRSRSSSVDEYVYDIFYQCNTTVQDWNSISTNVATITGLPPSALDDYDSDSEEEFVDEADEDSNEENWYANDYPEDEDPSSSSDIGDGDEYAEDDDGEESGKFSGWR